MHPEIKQFREEVMNKKKCVTCGSFINLIHLVTLERWICKKCHDKCLMAIVRLHKKGDEEHAQTNKNQ